MSDPRAIRLQIAECYRAGHDGRPGFTMRFHASEPDFADGIALLKLCVPASERSYDPQQSEWWVSDGAAQTLGWLIEGLAAHLAQPALPGLEP